MANIPLILTSQLISTLIHTHAMTCSRLASYPVGGATVIQSGVITEKLGGAVGPASQIPLG